MIVQLIAAFAGLFTIIAAASDWNWFFEHPKARFFVKIFGRQGARIFYAGLGSFILLISLSLCGLRP